MVRCALHSLPHFTYTPNLSDGSFYDEEAMSIHYAVPDLWLRSRYLCCRFVPNLLIIGHGPHAHR